MLSDLRYALRTLLKSPAFAGVAVLTLALGIGANTAIFSVLDGVLLRPAPYHEMDRLMMVWETDRNSGTSREPASIPDYADFRDRAARFEVLAALAGGEATLTPVEGDPIRLPALSVTHQFLPMVGIQAVAGRVFSADDDIPGAPQVTLISTGLWERLYDRHPDAVGRTLLLNETPYTVIGVVPTGADFGALQVLDAAAYSRGFADRGERSEVAVWVPMRPNPQTASRDNHPIFMVGRLAPGATPGSAQDEMATIAADLEATYPSNAARGAFVEPLEDVVFGPVRPALFVLLAAVGLVLVVASANVANLLLARGASRIRDVAVRTALGAGFRRLAGQFLLEGLVLALIGSAAGVVLAIWGTEALLALAPADIPRLDEVGVNPRVLAVTLGVATIVGVVFGLVPTVQAMRLDLHTSLKGESRGTVSAGPARTRTRQALVVAQLALAVVLVVGAGLLMRSFWRLQAVDPGFSAEGVIKAEFILPRTRYPVNFADWPNFESQHRFNAAVLVEAAGLPGVESAALAGNHPLDAGFTNSISVVGREAEAADWPEISVRRVTPEYFGTVGLPLRRGRLLENGDHTFAPPTLLVNEAAVARYFPNQDPIGQQINLWGSPRTVVGIVADERFHGLANQAPAAAYLPLAQAPGVNGVGTLLLRVRGDPARFATTARQAIRAVDPGLAVFGVEPLRRTVARSIGQQRFTMLLLGAFAGVAVLLAMVGVHGMLSYMVARRTPELGIRMALGATRREVSGLVVREGLRLAGIGLAVGLGAALLSTHLLQRLLFGVSSTDPLTFLAVAGLVLAVAVVASWVPALRATRTDPIEALRHE